MLSESKIINNACTWCDVFTANVCVAQSHTLRLPNVAIPDDNVYTNVFVATARHVYSYSS